MSQSWCSSSATWVRHLREGGTCMKRETNKQTNKQTTNKQTNKQTQRLLPGMERAEAAREAIVQFFEEIKQEEGQRP